MNSLSSTSDYTRTGYTMRKFQDETIDFNSEYSSRPWIYFRLAEIYLNYAEIQYELGNEGIAREYVNKIRKRVHLPDIESSGNDLLEDIRHERRIELCSMSVFWLEQILFFRDKNYHLLKSKPC